MFLHSKIGYRLFGLLALLFVMLFVFAGGPEAQDFGFGEPDRLDLKNPVEAYALFSVTALEPGGESNAALIVEIERPWHINSSKPYEDWLIAAKVSFDTLDGLTPYDISYPKGHDIDLAGSKMSLYDGKVIIEFKVKADANIAAGDYRIPVSLDYQPCDDKQCSAPNQIATTLKVTIGTGGESANSAIFSRSKEEIEDNSVAATEIEVATAGSEADQDASDLQRLVDEYGFWGYLMALGLAFITGLILSFSPCTYPMIPITVSIFAGQQRSFGRGFFLSLVYVTSMAVVYGIMGLIVAMVGGVFGAWLASPPVVVGIVIVFIIFSLSMFGVYELQVPASLRDKLGSTKTEGGVVGSMILGLVAALVVSPCVGPFVAGILLYVATSGSPLIGFLILFVFAMGLGTLYMLIGTFSSVINKLPRSGEWMETVKKFFGFILLLMAVYFLQTIISPTMTAIAAGFVLLALGVFGGGLDRLAPESGFFLRLKKFVGVLAFIFGLYLLMGTVLLEGLILPPASDWLPTATVNSEFKKGELIDWNRDLESGLALAKSEGKPVVIDTWATWCANCRVLDKEVFGNEEVAAEISRFKALKIQLEKAGSPETKQFMKKFNMKIYSLPTVLVLDRQGRVHKMIQGVISADEMLEILRSVN